MFAKDNWVLDCGVPLDWDMETALDWEVPLAEVMTLHLDTQPWLDSSIDAARRPFEACHSE